MAATPARRKRLWLHFAKAMKLLQISRARQIARSRLGGGLDGTSETIEVGAPAYSPQTHRNGIRTRPGGCVVGNSDGECSGAILRRRRGGRRLISPVIPSGMAVNSSADNGGHAGDDCHANDNGHTGDDGHNDDDGQAGDDGHASTKGHAVVTEVGWTTPSSA